MKVAIEFYGHLRSFRDAANGIKEYLVNQYEDADIFIHTWDETDHSGLTWHNPTAKSRGANVTDDDIKFLQEFYRPKKLLIEPQIKLENDPKYIMLMTENPTPFSMITNVFYTKWKVNELRKEYEQETGKKYDFVIQARLDLYFRKPFNLEKYIEYRAVINNKGKLNIDISKKFFYASDRWIQNHNTDDLLYAGGSDVMYFGKPEVIDTAVSVYKNLNNINFEKDFYSNEYLMLYSMIQKGLEPVKILFEKDIDFGILRTAEVLKSLRPEHSSSRRTTTKDLIIHRSKKIILFFLSPFDKMVLKFLLKCIIKTKQKLGYL